MKGTYTRENKEWEDRKDAEDVNEPKTGRQTETHRDERREGEMRMRRQ